MSHRFGTPSSIRAAVALVALSLAATVLGGASASAQSGLSAAELGTIERTAPTIVGDLVPGTALSIDVGSYSPADVKVSIQWAVGGVRRPFAPTLTLTEADAGKTVSAKVVLTHDGYLTSTAWANASGVVTSGYVRNDPTIGGALATGGQLGAYVGTFSPASASVSYQWYVGGVRLAGATSKYYVLAPGDASKKIQLKVTLSSPGLADSVRWASREPARLTPPKLSVKGTFAEGNDLSAAVGALPDGDWTLSYKWYIESITVPGATADHYTLAPGDTNHRVKVGVTFVRDGYYPVTVFATRYPAKIERTTPTISGALVTGTTLVASPGTFAPADAAVTYQWYVGGVKQTGETAAEYTLQPGDSAQRVMVEVTLTNDGYFVSSVTKTLYPKEIERKAPSIGGTLATGSTLTAYVGTTTPSDVNISYQWYVGGAVVAGATSKYFTLRAEDAGQRVSVHVTVSRDGYLTSTLVATRYP